MSEISLQKTLALQAEIAKALVKISSDMIGVSEYLAGYHKVLAIEPKTASVVEVEHQKQKQLDRVDPRILDSVKAARIAIGTANKPLPLGVLYDDARAKGFQIFTPNPKGTYSARLREKADRVGLVFLNGFGWWLSERPYEPAKHPSGTPTRRRYRVRWNVEKRPIPQEPASKTA